MGDFFWFYNLARPMHALKSMYPDGILSCTERSLTYFHVMVLVKNQRSPCVMSGNTVKNGCFKSLFLQSPFLRHFL
uniref:Uncharacterized protein n=1 Tax=Rhizophora mucronata TaxID=61149 RepID=A0A2P2KUE9_RHIMU